MKCIAMQDFVLANFLVCEGMRSMEKLFKIKERGSTYRREIVGGLTTFFAKMCIRDRDIAIKEQMVKNSHLYMR